jgi:hypothetical protein
VLWSAAVLTVNVPVDEPAATDTDAGTVAYVVLLDDNVTTMPAAGAGPFNVTVPVEDDPPVTDDGLSETPVTVAGLIVSAAVRLTEFKVPVIVALVVAETVNVVTVKVAEVAPAATVTVAGTFAFVLLEERLTIVPPVGAAVFNVTVPVEFTPPIRVVGARESPLSPTGLTVSVAV